MENLSFDTIQPDPSLPPGQAVIGANSIYIPNNYWKVVGEARNQWAVSTHVEPQYVGSTATFVPYHEYMSFGNDLYPPTPSIPLGPWEKICLFLKIFFTGRS